MTTTNRDLTTEELALVAIGLRDAARNIAKCTEVQPVTFLVNAQAQVCGVSARFTGETPEAIERVKDDYAAAVRQSARQHRAVMAVMITEAWVSDADAWERTHRHRVGGGGRAEILMVTIERLLVSTISWSARIGVEGGEGERRVGEWIEIEGMHVGGRMVGVLPDVSARGKAEA